MIAGILWVCLVLLPTVAVSVATEVPKQIKVEQITKAKQLKTNRGIKLFFIKNGGAPLVHIIINFRNSGTAYLEKTKAGIPTLYEYTFCCGCGKYSQSQITKALNDISCDVACNINEDSLSFSITMPQAVMQTAIPLVCCLINEPSFEENDVKNLQIKLPGPHRITSDPINTAVHTIIPSLIFESHPYGNGIYGEDEDFINLTIDDLRKYKDKFLTIANAEVCVCGNLTEPEAIQLVDQIFSKTKKGEKNADIVVDVVPKIKSHVRYNYVDSPMSTIVFVQKGASIKSSKRYAALLLHHIIGAPGLFRSRMLSTLRIQLGLIYSGSVSSMHLLHADFCFGILQTSNSNVKKTLDAVKNILKQVRNGDITQSDLDFVKHNIKGKILVNLRTTEAICNFFYNAMAHDLGENALEDFINGIEAVKLEDVHAVAQELIDDDNILYIVIGGKCKEKTTL
jgi:zinc protease